jgi:hypothetical protein
VEPILQKSHGQKPKKLAIILFGNSSTKKWTEMHSISSKLKKKLKLLLNKFCRVGLSKLKFFVPKSVSPRGTPFNLELGENFSIRVQMFLKNSAEQAIKLSFNPVNVEANGRQQEV